MSSFWIFPFIRCFYLRPSFVLFFVVSVITLLTCLPLHFRPGKLALKSGGQFDRVLAYINCHNLHFTCLFSISSPSPHQFIFFSAHVLTSITNKQRKKKKLLHSKIVVSIISNLLPFPDDRIFNSFSFFKIKHSPQYHRCPNVFSLIYHQPRWPFPAPVSNLLCRFLSIDCLLNAVEVE